MPQTKSLNKRSLPVSVINPKEYFVWLNKRLWPGAAPPALLQSQFSVISCSRTPTSSNGESLGEKRQRLDLHPQRNLGPIPERLRHKSSWINKLGTWLEKTLGYFSKLQWSRSYICIYVNFESNVNAFASTTP